MGAEDLADELLDAVEVGDVVRARQLLQAGADPSANSWDMPVMAEAIDHLDEPMVRLLLEFGVEPGGAERGGTWLHAAAAGPTLQGQSTSSSGLAWIPTASTTPYFSSVTRPRLRVHPIAKGRLMNPVAVAG